MSTNTTIRRVKSSEYRSNNRKPIKRISFPFYGKVEMMSNSSRSILVSRGDKDSKFWLNFEKGSKQYEVGETYKFDITLSTYRSDTGILRTNLWIVNSELVTEEEDLLKGFDIAHMEVDIKDCRRTSIPNLFVLTMRRLEDGKAKETYEMRYYDEGDSVPDMSRCTIKFELFLSKQQIGQNGNVYTEIKTKTVVGEDGSELTVEYPIYKPALSVIGIGTGE